MTPVAGAAAGVDSRTAWEYLIVALPTFQTATAERGGSDAVSMLNREGAHDWEAVGMTSLADGAVAVLMKRRVVQAR